MGVCQSVKTVLSSSALSNMRNQQRFQQQSQQQMSQEYSSHSTMRDSNHQSLSNSKFSKGEITENYTLEKIIGTGAFGRVYKALEKQTSIKRAIKVIPKNRVKTQQILREFQILKELDHPNIIKILQIYEGCQKFYMVCQYCQGPNLLELLLQTRSFNQSTAALYMLQVLRGIAHIHKKNIVHRDIKPENLLFTQNSNDSLLKIIDFGLSVHINNRRFKQKVGTVSFTQMVFLAPEVLSNSYNHMCDLWSCGILLYIMLTGAPPFKSTHQKQLMKQIKKFRFSSHLKGFELLSEAASDLIRRLLQRDQFSRISAQQALKHPWIKQKTSSFLNNLKFNQEYLQRLTHFRCMSKFQYAIYNYMAKYMQNPRNNHDLNTLFLQLDANGDGKIQKAELQYAINKLGLGDIINISQILERCDANKDGYLEYSEFVTATFNWKNFLTPQVISKVFSAFDVDSNGIISVGDLKEIEQSGDVQFLDTPEKLISSMDDSGEDVVNFDKFNHMFNQYLNY